MIHRRPITMLAAVLVLALLSSRQGFGAVSPVVGGDRAAPALQNILPDKPKPLVNIISGMPSPETQENPQGTRDPLGVLAKDMGHVVGELDSRQTDQFVQGEQDQIVRNMDVLIKQLEKSCCKSGSGTSASMNPTKPMNKSQLAGGPGGVHDLHDPRAGQQNWGDLPPKQRDQILQSRTEGFPAGYENILQSYFFRLSQEQTARDAGATPAPWAQP